jgi:Na+/citrate or Na+/malate symporter
MELANKEEEVIRMNTLMKMLQSDLRKAKEKGQLTEKEVEEKKKEEEEKEKQKDKEIGFSLCLVVVCVFICFLV